MTIDLVDTPQEARRKELADVLTTQVESVMSYIDYDERGIIPHFLRRCLVESMPFVISKIIDERCMRRHVPHNVDDWFSGRPHWTSDIVLKLAPKNSSSIASGICIAVVYSLIHALCDPAKTKIDNGKLITAIKGLHDQMLMICKDSDANRIDELKNYYLLEQTRRIRKVWSQHLGPLQEGDPRFEFRMWENCYSGFDTSIEGVCRWAWVFCSPADDMKNTVKVLTDWIRGVVEDFLALCGIDAKKYMAELSEFRQIDF